MSGGSHSPTPDTAGGAADEGTVVFTDGACSGNPGPGGWAWVNPAGGWESGFDPATTNQRMEIAAALAACEAHTGALTIVSDSTYVVNCWRDRWWEGWIRRDWKNSAKKPVANRDLWERLVPHFRDRGDLRLRWVKGHSGDRWNDIADRLAVAAVQRGRGSSGDGEPGEADLAEPDAPAARRRTGGASGSGDTSAAPHDGGADAGTTADPRVAADSRVPVGHRVTVTGLRSGVDDAVLSARISAVLGAMAELHTDLVVMTGLRSGAESAGAAAAAASGVPYVVVLPYPDPTAGWPEVERAEFERRRAGASDSVVLEKRRPDDLGGRRSALSRRDGWLRANSHEAILVVDGRDAETEAALRRWEQALGDAVWRLEVEP